MTPMSYADALAYIHRINWEFCKPGLERVGELCEKLGNPQDRLCFVHVAGTNGKGSFCAMLASVLQAAGYKTGLYTSPYIVRFNERMMIDGNMIGDDELAQLTSEVQPVADAMAEPPTEFELITAIAFLWFARHGCRIVVLECGMGGRLDATNLIRTPLLSVITGIALDHTKYLGNTVEAIAGEKAGIIKHGVPVLYGGSDSAAAAVIAQKAAESGSAFYRTDLEKICVRNMSLDGTVFSFDGYDNLFLPLLGDYQPQNAANVLMAVEILRKEHFLISDDAVRNGVSSTVWHARFECLARDPIVIADGAHNPQGIAAAVRSIRRYFGENKVLMLGGVMADKDHKDMVAALAPVCREMFAVRPDNPRAMDPAAYAAEFLRAGVSASSYPTVQEGVFAAMRRAQEQKCPLVCLGSLYQYAAVSAAVDAFLDVCQTK